MMDGFARMFVMVSTLTLSLVLSAEQIYAKKMLSPCILTASESALVDKLMRFYESPHPDQVNIKECVVFGTTAILIYYEDGHTGLFSLGEITYSDNKQKQVKPRATKVLNKLHDVSGQHTRKEEAGKLYNEFVGVWSSVDLPDELTEENLIRADLLIQKLLDTTLPDGELMVPLLGSNGNRYLGLVEGHSSLSKERLGLFYGKYLDTSDTDSHARTEDIPTDNDKQIATKKLIKILEVAEPNKKVFATLHISREIKRVDPNAYVRLIKRGVIIESNE